jgi:hypothetical protein
MSNSALALDPWAKSLLLKKGATPAVLRLRAEITKDKKELVIEDQMRWLHRARKHHAQTSPIDISPLLSICKFA